MSLSAGHLESITTRARRSRSYRGASIHCMRKEFLSVGGEAGQLP